MDFNTIFNNHPRRYNILSVAVLSSSITAKTYSHIHINIHSLNNGCRIMHSQEHHPISRGSENSIYCCILILKFSVRVFLKMVFHCTPVLSLFVIYISFRIYSPFNLSVNIFTFTIHRYLRIKTRLSADLNFIL